MPGKLLNAARRGREVVITVFFSSHSGECRRPGVRNGAEQVSLGEQLHASSCFNLVRRRLGK